MENDESDETTTLTNSSTNSDMHSAFRPLFGATSYLDDEAAIEKDQGSYEADTASLVRVCEHAIERPRLDRGRPLDGRCVSVCDDSLGARDWNRLFGSDR